METLYRKVAVSERLPKEDNWYHTNRGGCDFDPNSKEFEDANGYTVQIQYWLEEIPNNTQQQLEKLEADKAELLEALEKVKNEMIQCLKFLRAEGYEYMEFENLSEVIYTIQKHKQ